MSSCGSEPETRTQFLLHCQNHKLSRSKLIKNVYNLGQTLRNYDDDESIPFKDTEHFDGSLIWNIYIFKIVLWSWLFTCIHSNFGRTSFGLNRIWVFFESLYIPYSYGAFLFYFVIYIYVFSTSSGLSEKRKRFPQGLSLVLYLYFRIFIFVLLNCESL